MCLFNVRIAPHWGPSIIEERHDMMSIPVRPAFLMGRAAHMSPGVYGRCWRRWQPALGSHIRGIAQGVSTQRATLESQCIRCRCIIPGGNCRAGEEHCKHRGHLLGLKGRGESEGSQGTAELARLCSVCGKCREGREGAGEGTRGAS